MGKPALPTTKRLFAVSGNRCAFPRCPVPLVDEASGKVTGKVCHIRAKQPGGPRFDANQTDEERHGFDNLLLLCPIHHDVLDSDVDSYTVERLLQIKSEHEKTHPNGTEPDDEVASLLISSVSSSHFEGSLLTNNQQSGGQAAHSITNLVLNSDLSLALEQDIQLRRDAHDLRIFESADSILGEEFLFEALSKLSWDHSYNRSFSTSVREFCYFLEQAGNQYLHKDLAALSSGMISVLKQLSDFLATH